MELGNTLRLLRVAAGLKQVDLAARVGVTPNYLSMVENGKRVPSLSFVKSISEELDIPVGLLFLNADAMTASSSPERQALFRRIRDLMLDIERVKLAERREHLDA